MPIPWLAALKGFVQAKVTSNANFSATANVNVDSDSTKNLQKVIYKNKGDVNYFNFPKDVTKETVDQIKALIDPAFERDEVAFIFDNSKALLKGYKGFEKSEDVQKILNFFQGKIPDLDFRLLETGLYIKYLVEEGKSTSKIKSDVIRQYGARGKNIVNLASAGYYSTHIKPLYEALSSQEGFSESDFMTEYERIVVELPFAIFVNASQTDEDILKEIAQKAEINIKYSVSEPIIVLHGYGSNAEAIEKQIPELQKIYKRIAPNTEYIGHLKITTIAIYYKELVE